MLWGNTDYDYEAESLVMMPRDGLILYLGRTGPLQESAHLQWAQVPIVM